jgi:hypothetical protein
MTDGFVVFHVTSKRGYNVHRKTFTVVFTLTLLMQLAVRLSFLLPPFCMKILLCWVRQLTYRLSGLPVVPSFSVRCVGENSGK